MRISSNIISVCLIGSGLATWGLTARSLVENPELDVPLNPMGINRSPYGEVFAMAMQSPIDTYFHAGMGEGHHHDHDEHSHEHDEHSHEHDGHSHEHDEHSHEHDGHSHEHDGHSKDDGSHDHKTSVQKLQQTESLNSKLLSLLEFMDEARYIRTNPKPYSESMKFHYRRETENKLRFAYELDPAHYGNYNSLHFFLTEPQMGTRPQITSDVMKLAKDTIDYCLKQENDPRPALTAAAACTNILHLMFLDHNNGSSTFTVEQMRQGIILLDHCIARYHAIAKQWDETKNWELLSPMRITECKTRYSFISKIRNAAETTVVRLENESKASR